MTDYLDMLEGLLANAKEAKKLYNHHMLDAVSTCQEFDRSWQHNLQRTRETFWADLEAPIDSCTLCGQPRTTEHNQMPLEEHERMRIARPSSKRPNNMRGRA